VTLPAAVERARLRPWAEVWYLLDLVVYRDKFGPAPESLTFHVSDLARYVPETGLGAIEYSGHVASWGEIGDALNPTDPTLAIATCDVTLWNNAPVLGITHTGAVVTAARLSDLIRTPGNPGGYDWEFGVATLSLWFRGGSVGEQLIPFTLSIEEPDAITEDTLVLHLAGTELDLEDRDTLLTITSDQWPSAAPQAVGQRIPLLTGAVRWVPGMFLVAGVLDRLRADMTATDPPTGGDLLLSTPDRVARMAAQAPLIVQVDQELILCPAFDIPTAKAKLITRSVNGTVAAPHARGAEASQVLARFVAVFGENRGGISAADLTALYTDETYKSPLDAPRHEIVLDDQDTWPGASLVTAIFHAGVAGSPAIFEEYPVEVREEAMLDQCGSPPANAPRAGTGSSLAGVPCLRLGLDAPCGSAFDVYRNLLRWNIAGLVGAQDSVILSLFRLPHSGVRSAQLAQIDWDLPLADGAATASILHTYGVILRPTTPVHSPPILVDVTAEFNAAKTAGRTSLVFRLELTDETATSFVTDWYGLGTLTSFGIDPQGVAYDYRPVLRLSNGATVDVVSGSMSGTLHHSEPGQNSAINIGMAGGLELFFPAPPAGTTVVEQTVVLEFSIAFVNEGTFKTLGFEAFVGYPPAVVLHSNGFHWTVDLRPTITRTDLQTWGLVILGNFTLAAHDSATNPTITWTVSATARITRRLAAVAGPVAGEASPGRTAAGSSQSAAEALLGAVTADVFGPDAGAALWVPPTLPFGWHQGASGPGFIAFGAVVAPPLGGPAVGIDAFTTYDQGDTLYDPGLFGFTNAGNGLFLWVAQFEADVPPTYGGYAFTKLAHGAGIGNDPTLWYLANPPTGAHNVVVSHVINGSPNQRRTFGGVLSVTGAGLVTLEASLIQDPSPTDLDLDGTVPGVPGSLIVSVAHGIRTHTPLYDGVQRWSLNLGDGAEHKALATIAVAS
jgi:hypothetical protein